MKKVLVMILIIATVISMISIKTNANEIDIAGADVIHKQANQILTINDIKAMYSSPHGDIQIENDNYTGYGNIVGIKSVDMVVETIEQIYRKTINIYVINNLGNVKAVTDYKDLHLRTDQILTPTQIVYVLENTGYVEITATTQMSIENNTYTANSSTPGTYVFEFRLINSAGLDQVYSSNIYVSDGNSLFVPDVIFETPPKAIDGIVMAITNIIYFAVFIGIGYFVIKYIPKKKKKRI